MYTGNIDRLWRMYGIANQLLAAIALAVGTTYLLMRAPKRVYALCTAVPLVFVVATVFTAGVESIYQWLNELAAWNLQLADPAATAAKIDNSIDCRMPSPGETRNRTSLAICPPSNG